MLELKGLTKRRTQGGVTFELRVPSLSLPYGQFCAVIGDSGCGKSTLLDILSLVLRPTQCSEFCLYGNLRTRNESPIDLWDLWKRDEEGSLAEVRQSHLGYVLQTGGLLPFLTVMQNIQLRSKINGKVSSRAEIHNIAAEMGVDMLLSKKPGFLSGGQRQRVAILRALIHKPRVVFLDEPTAAVDKTRAKLIIEKLLTLAEKENTTVVMVTHDQTLVENIADKTFGFHVTQESDLFSYSICAERR